MWRDSSVISRGQQEVICRDLQRYLKEPFLLKRDFMIKESDDVQNLGNASLFEKHFYLNYVLNVVWFLYKGSLKF